MKTPSRRTARSSAGSGDALLLTIESWLMTIAAAPAISRINRNAIPGHFGAAGAGVVGLMLCSLTVKDHGVEHANRGTSGGSGRAMSRAIGLGASDRWERVRCPHVPRSALLHEVRLDSNPVAQLAGELFVCNKVQMALSHADQDLRLA